MRKRIGAALIGASFILAACTVTGSPSTAPVGEGQGASLYATHCQACHGDRNGQGRIATAPPHNGEGHTWHHPDAQLRDWTLQGRLGLNAMPAFRGTLTEDEVDSILAFIKTWWTDEQRARQADISRRYEASLRP